MIFQSLLYHIAPVLANLKSFIDGKSLEFGAKKSASRLGKRWKKPEPA